MSIPVIQTPSIILPTWHPNNNEHEDILDLLEHTSSEVFIADIHEKIVHIVAVENIAVGALGNLQVWVELSPVPSTTSAAYWAAIGGGGGAIAPVAPLVIVATNVLGTTHGEFMAWVAHSHYCRVVVQCPVNAGLANPDYWQVQIVLSGKTP